MTNQQRYFHSRVEVIAYFHNVLRPTLLNAIKNQELTEAAKALTGFSTPMQLLEAQFGLPFLDMTTIIWIGSTLEDCLKWYYQRRMGLATYREVDQSLKKRYGSGAFQRFSSRSGKDDVVALYRNELAMDLSTMPKFKSVVEVMLDRHLYAHRLGVLDDQHIERLKELTGYDILSNPEVKTQYEAEDIYWLQPLEKIPAFLENVRAFFFAFPGAI